MKLLGLVAILVAGVFAFVVGQRLSADAIGMAVGVLFGVLAGIPAALLMLASGRRREEAEFEDEEPEEEADPYRGLRRRGQPAYGVMPPQAPVIVFAPPTSAGGAPYGYTNQYVAPHPAHSAPPALPGPTAHHPVDNRRAFKVVGEQEEWITEW